MLKNYLRIALRNLFKDKTSFLINMGGLAVGMAVVILNGLWIWDELSFNTNHKNYDRIAQVMTMETEDGETGYNNTIPYPLALEIKSSYKPLFKHIVLGTWSENVVLLADEKKISAKGQYIEDGAPEMLTLKMIHGSWAGLKDPNSIMLSASTAKALFGNEDPVNKTMSLNNKINVIVTGVYDDLPLNANFQDIQFFSPFALWLSQNKWAGKASNDWHNHFLRVYVEINPANDIQKVSTLIKDAELNNVKEFKEIVAQHPQVFLFPMSSWHLHKFKRGQPDNEAVNNVWLVGIIGIFVLILACINFVNLSTARSEKRAKEVGIRKTIGSMRWQLVKQFITESFLVVILAFVLATGLVFVSLPWFNELAEKQIEMPWNNSYFWLISIGFISITGLLAGSYPAFYLSSFKPVQVLKGVFKAGRFASLPRKTLVVLQFTVSVVLIISTIIVHRQIQHAKDRPVGYTRDRLMMIQMKSDDFYGKFDLMRTELVKTGAVTEMSESMGSVTQVWSGNDGFEWKGKSPAQDRSFGTLAVTASHGKTVGWQFIAGRDFSNILAADSAGVIINEAAVKYMGLQNPVGETVTWKFRDKSTSYTVLGVIKDMLQESPYDPVKPGMFFIKAPNGKVNWINIKINPNVSVSGAIPKIEAVFKKLIPSAPFDFKFVDEEYALKFAAEERIGKLATFFAILAIFISCLGLFGLASFVAEKRTKEIGIRKVLGATVSNLWSLLSRDFVVLVIISCLISIPVAFYFLTEWLQKFQYRTEISWWIFVAATAGALAITLLTVSFQAIKAALINPVKSLRTE